MSEQGHTFRKNKLIPNSTRLELCAMRGFYSQEMEVRHSGRSLALAFHTIGEAMLHPGTTYPIRDHYAPDQPQHHVHQHLAKNIQMILEQNGMRHFKVIPNDPLRRGPSLVYDIFEEVRYQV